MGDKIGKWAAGTSYGPVLSQTDLYLLQTDLEINPVLAGKSPNFNLLFNLRTGELSGYNLEVADRDVHFSQKTEPATVPRVSQIVIITPHSPWCTIVKNEKGVTNEDVINALWKDYAELVTEAEFASVPVRFQDHIKRMAANHMLSGGNQYAFYASVNMQNQFKRVDWLRDRFFFQSLERSDSYAISRLGFKAPNIFKMELTS